MRIARLGKRIYRDALVERQDPQGKTYNLIGGDPPTGVVEERTDFGCLAEGCVSITPVHLDLTSHMLVDRLKPWERDCLLGGMV